MSLDSTHAKHLLPDGGVRAGARGPSSGDSLRGSTGRISSGRRSDWRLGGRTVRPWRSSVLAVALLGVGAGVLAGGLLTTLVSAPWTGWAATALLWLGMLIPIVWAFTRARPIGLLRFRLMDLLWGVGLGLLLRVVQGWLAVAAGGSGALPSYPSIGGSFGDAFVLADVVAPVLIAPLVEEFFFRGVILVSVYTLLRRSVGALMAGAVAVVVSTAVFVLLHSMTQPMAADAVISLGLLGVVCGLLVILTGRIWGAVLVHVVYNGSFVLLALAGTLLS